MNQEWHFKMTAAGYFLSLLRTCSSHFGCLLDGNVCACLVSSGTLEPDCLGSCSGSATDWLCDLAHVS